MATATEVRVSDLPVDPREYEYWIGNVIVTGGSWQGEAARHLNDWASDGWEPVNISTFENGILVSCDAVDSRPRHPRELIEVF